MAEKKKTFEASLEELEKIVRQLEEGELPLEESLKLFESGVKLSRECQVRLNEAERRIEVLMRDENGNPSLQAIDPENVGIEKREPKIKKRIVFDEDEEATF